MLRYLLRIKDRVSGTQALFQKALYQVLVRGWVGVLLEMISLMSTDLRNISHLDLGARIEMPQ